jgi:phosphoglycerate dehydrogenase-like enzyme
VRSIVRATPEEFAGEPPADVFFCAKTDGGSDAKLLALSPGVRWIHSRWAGIDGLASPELRASGVPVSNGRGAFARALAEWTLAGLLHFAKDLPRLERQRAERLWQPYAPGQLHGQCLGIVGFGGIGRATARLARAFGMRVLALRRRPGAGPEALADAVYGPERLADLFAECDAVQLALPLTPATRRLIGARELRAMKNDAVLVNVGRGAVVDEAALVEALRAGRPRAAALDVFETEPLPRDSPLWSLPNVLISPHAADQVPGWLYEATLVFRQNLDRFLAGEPIENRADLELGY